jgi:hypothetical protein
MKLSAVAFLERMDEEGQLGSYLLSSSSKVSCTWYRAEYVGMAGRLLSMVLKVPMNIDPDA